ncbi:MAG: c-type cytochrome [Thermodesulfovibrionales bacterium]|nr:c-type cytochrome [Thermodesulfovibrionales bacterium]
MRRTIFLVLFILFLTFPVFSQQLKNPYAGNQLALKEGAEVYKKNCEACHGPGGRGDICPDLTKKTKKYGNSDADLFFSIAKGRPGGMPNWDTTLGTEKIWKVITYLRSIEK